MQKSPMSRQAQSCTVAGLLIVSLVMHLLELLDGRATRLGPGTQALLCLQRPVVAGVGNRFVIRT
jgi:hypothetical protein